MKSRRSSLLVFLALTLSASAQLPLLTAKVVGRAGFPKNHQRDIVYFDGCVDDSGPWSMSSSACLGPLERIHYEVDNLDDNNFVTCWAVRGGIGSWFALSGLISGRSDNIPIRGFSIVNGYAKSPERWAQNARVRTMDLNVAGKTRATIRLQDTPAVQSVEFPEFLIKGKEELRLTIRSIYPGSYFNDLCISEFQLDAGH